MASEAGFGRYSTIRREAARPDVVNVHPIQRGGLLTSEAEAVLQSFKDGYSMCDFCMKGRIDMVGRPPVHDFLRDIASFLGMDVARLTNRCRDALFVVIMGLKHSRGRSSVVIDSNSHYSTYLAVEAAHLDVVKVPNTGYPEFRVLLDAYREAVEEVEDRTGEPPLAAVLTHADPYYGNLNDPRPVARVCRDHGIPLILNAAYTAGIMPLSGRELGIDALTSSGHKSWASSGPIGILALSSRLADDVLIRSRRFPGKELYLLGCPVLGVALATLMASFSAVVERVKRWPEEVEKTRWLVSELERIEGVKQLGVRPKEHTLVCFETPGFHEVAKRHRRKGFFLLHELKKRNIVGIQPGLTKRIKLNTYGLSWTDVERVARAFQDVAEQHGLAVS